MSENLETRVARIEERQDFTLEKVERIETQVGELHKAVMEGRAVKLALTFIVALTTFITGTAAALATVFGWWGSGK